MTEAELELLRLKVQQEASRVVLHAVVRIAARCAPSVFPSQWRTASQALRRDHGEIAPTGMAPEYSDLLAAEYQQALDDLLTFIESGFRG